jgi:hypothetical protein
MEMEIAAWLASVLVFTTFFMKTMILLRVVAVISNVAFIAYALLGLRYGIFEKVLPILVLHSLLLPLNLLRVREMKRIAIPQRTIYAFSERHRRALWVRGGCHALERHRTQLERLQRKSKGALGPPYGR